MSQNTADKPSTGAAKPNAGGESPQAPAQPRPDPIAETKLLEAYYLYISEVLPRAPMAPGPRRDVCPCCDPGIPGVSVPGAGPFLW